MNPRHAPQKGIVVYRMKNPPSHGLPWKEHDARDTIHDNIFFLEVGYEKPGQWFLTTPSIDRAIREHALPDEAFGYIMVLLRYHDTGDRILHKIRKGKLVITKPSVEKVLRHEELFRLLNRKINNEIKREVKRMNERYYALKAKTQTREQKWKAENIGLLEMKPGARKETPKSRKWKEKLARAGKIARTKSMRAWLFVTRSGRRRR